MMHDCSNDAYPLISSHVPCACVSSKWSELLCIIGASIDERNGYCPLNESIKLYSGVATGPNLSLTIDHMSLLHSLDFSVIPMILM